MPNVGDMLKEKSTAKPKVQSNGWQNLPYNPNQITKQENLPYVPNPSDTWKNLPYNPNQAIKKENLPYVPNPSNTQQNLPYNPNQTTKSSYEEVLAQVKGKLNGAVPNPQYNAKDLYNQAMQQSLNANAQAMANAVAQAEANRGQIKQVYDSAQKQNHINNVMGAKNLSESLIANGLDKQGFTESSKLAHEGNYQTNFSNTENSRNAEITKLNNEIARIKSEHGLRGSQITENYLNMINERLYQEKRDAVGDSQWNLGFEHQKGQDMWGREQAEIQNGFQESGITGMHKGKPTYQNSQDAWANGMTKEQWEWQKKQDEQKQKNWLAELELSKKKVGSSGSSRSGGTSGSYSGSSTNDNGNVTKKPPDVAPTIRKGRVNEVSNIVQGLPTKAEKARLLINMAKVPVDKNGNPTKTQGYLTTEEFWYLVDLYGIRDNLVEKED